MVEALILARYGPTMRSAALRITAARCSKEVFSQSGLAASAASMAWVTCVASAMLKLPSVCLWSCGGAIFARVLVTIFLLPM